MRIRSTVFLFALWLLVLLSACRPHHPTPFDALTEWPGKLEDADPAVLESVRVLQEEEVAGGLVMLYSIPSAEPGEHVLASTFVSPDGSGWRAQSSGWTNYSDTDDFVVAGIAGGNITDLTTMSGISSKGEIVRIEWSDGQINIIPVEDGSFLFSRPETLSVRRVELLDGSGNVLQSDEFGTAETVETPGLTETPGEIMMSTPTATPVEIVIATPFTKTTAEASPPELCPEGISASEPPSLTPLPVQTPTPTIKGYALQSVCWEGEWYFTLTLGLNVVQPCVGRDADISQEIPRYTVRGVDSLKALVDQLPAGEYITWCDSGRPAEEVVGDVIAFSGQRGVSLTLMTDLATDSPSLPVEIPSTGIPGVDQAIAAIMENDLEPRRNLIRYTSVRCTHEIVGMGGPPFCEPDQEEGTPVEKFPIMGPEGAYIDPAEIDRVLTFRAEELYGAFRREKEEASHPSDPSEAFGLLFTTGSTLGEGSHILVYLDEEGKIVSLDFVFWSLQEHLEKIVGEWLIAPQ